MTSFNNFLVLIYKLRAILSKEQKKKSIFVFIGIFFASFLELISVSAVLPFVYALLSPQKLLDNKFVNSFLSFFCVEINSSKELIILLGFIIFLIFIFRCLGILYFNYVRLDFENEIMRTVNNEMVSSYLYKPYSITSKLTTADALRGITNSSTSVYYILEGVFLIALNLINSLLIVLFLFWVDPFLSLSSFVLSFIFVVSFLKIIRKKVKKSGIDFNHYILLLNQCTTEIIDGLKEIFVLRRQNYFYQKVSKISSLKKIAERNFRFIQFCPSVIIQTIVVSLILFMVCLFVEFDYNTELLLPILVTFGYGAIKIIPNVSAILSSISSILYYYDSFNDACKKICEDKKFLDVSVPFWENALERINPVDFSKIIISNLNWKYNLSTNYVFSNLNMEIHKGDCVGLIGQSGAGKSTLTDILLGVYCTDKNNAITVDGVDLYSIISRWSKTVGFVPQKLFLFNDSIRNNILFGEENNPENEIRIWNALEKAQLKDYVKTLPDGIDTVIGEKGGRLSGGQRQRLALARALFNDPSFLILDEATSALDNETENAVMEAISPLIGKKTILIIAHRLSTIRKCNKVYKIADRKAFLVNE